MLTGTVPLQRAAAGHVESPPPLAVAVLSPVVADAATFTFKVNTVFAPTASVPLNVQDRVVVPVQSQFVPLELANVMPLGKLSATLIGAVVAAVPLFMT